MVLTRGGRAATAYQGCLRREAIQYAVNGLPEGWRGYVATSDGRWQVLAVEPDGAVPEWTGDYPDLDAALNGLRIYVEPRTGRGHEARRDRAIDRGYMSGERT